MKVDCKKVVLSGIAAGIVMLIVGTISGMLLSADYMATPELWKPMTGAWTYQMVALNFLEGLLYAYVFALIYKGLPGKGWNKGLNYGFLVWLVGTLPGMLMTYFTMAVPTTIVLSWTFGGLVSLLIAGAVIAAVCGKV